MKRLVPITAAVAVICGSRRDTLCRPRGGAMRSSPVPASAAGSAPPEPDGGDESVQLGELANAACFSIPSVFATSPNPMQTRRPAGDLGPRYTITYSMPGPNGANELRQDVYPYAKPSPVTHTDPGQRYYGSERTVGGWYVATYDPEGLVLVAAGLPSSPPDGEGPYAAVLAGRRPRRRLSSWCCSQQTLLIAARRPPSV